MPEYSVQVSNISPTTTEVSLKDFFSFCGTINKIDHNEKTATIYFEKPSAVNTALMLNGGILDDTHLVVTAETQHEEHHDEHHEPGAPIDQADKPRAGIAAEYLAKGYVLSDHILKQAIEIDHKQGISKRFLSYFNSLDSSLGARALGPDQTISGKVTSTVTAATQQARSVDEQRGYSKIAGDYYAKALGTPLGQKIRDFYTTTSKQVLDIHEEARRLAAMHKQQADAQAQPSSSVEPTAAQPTTQAAPTAV